MFFVFVLCLSTILAFASAASFLRLQFGEKRPLQIPDGSEVSVDPKGIVKIQRDSMGEKWMILGIGSGTADIRIKSADKVGTLQILRATVESQAEVKGRRPIKRGYFPSELCSHPGIHCRADLGLITGTSSSYEWRMHARNTCRQSKSCQVEVNLTSDESQRMLRVYREKIGAGYDVHLTSGGEISVGILCSEASKTLLREHIDFLTSGAVDRGEIGLVCRRPTISQRFLIKFQLNAISNSTASEFGLNDPKSPNNRLGLIAEPPRSAVSILNDLKTSNRSKSLGEPSLIVDLGQKATLNSGSEIISGTEIDRQTGESKPHYKNLGLEIEAEILDQHEGIVRTRLLARMKSQALRNENRFSTQEISTEVSLKLGAEQILGTSQMSGDHHLSSNSNILAKIPIIGPLLEYQSKDQAVSTVVISAIVEVID